MAAEEAMAAAMGDHSARRTGRSSHCERSVERQGIAFRKPSGCHRGMPAMVAMVAMVVAVAVAVAALGLDDNVGRTVPRSPGEQLEE